MPIKMRNNTKPNAVCCNCGETQEKVLNMFDVCVGKEIFTLCDTCNNQLLYKCINAECYKNSRVKTPRDIKIINHRRNKERQGK